MATPKRISGLAYPDEGKIRGIFGEHPGFTPKYAQNESVGGGSARDRYFDTMARLFVQVGPEELERFLTALGTVDPDTAKIATALAGTNLGDGTGTGYVDFTLQRASHGLSEKADIIETLGDYVVYYFGTAAPVFSYSGTLVNSIQDDQAVNMYRLYRDVLRGTKLAERQKLVRLRYDSYIVSGSIQNLNWDMNADNEMLMPFGFQILVRNIALIPNPEYDFVDMENQLFAPQELVQTVDWTSTTAPRITAIPYTSSAATQSATPVATSTASTYVPKDPDGFVPTGTVFGDPIGTMNKVASGEPQILTYVPNQSRVPTF